MKRVAMPALVLWKPALPLVLALALTTPAHLPADILRSASRL